METCDLCGSAERAPFLEKGGHAYVRCEACGFVQAEMTPEEFERLNESEFTGAVSEYAAKAGDARRRRRYHRRLARLAPFRENGRLVEIGASTGAFLLCAREAGWSPVGVEPVDACARHARERHGLDVRTDTLEGAGLPAGSCDVVYAHAVLEHLTSPRRVLSEVARILRPGGALFVDTVNVDSYTFDRVGSGWKLVDPAIHYCLWTPALLRRALTSAGLEVRRMASHGVRLRPSAAGRPRGLARLADELAKLPLSAAARLTLRGESIAALAVRATLGE
ncbi:MAG: class I SAM-dependent methyltransferase [Planctomycetota bacterium]|jgi:SAM-dependent methyltransferase|nr:class I SAM-dependent methyltransferase [Planctomycetota bacterium]MDP6763230.1 class I SAM-dependent methyltransferase [Planctomycetota bacterium]MDP6990561.1 class I SAM-dependent methyltransferase [Planctomycetota bacterium]